MSTVAILQRISISSVKNYAAKIRMNEKNKHYDMILALTQYLRSQVCVCVIARLPARYVRSFVVGSVVNLIVL